MANEIPVYDWACFRGFTTVRTFTYSTSDEVPIPIPVDQQTIKHTFKVNQTELVIVEGVESAQGSTVQVIDEPEGIWRTELTDEEMALFPLGEGSHWVGFLGDDGRYFPILHGRFIVSDISDIPVTEEEE